MARNRNTDVFRELESLRDSFKRRPTRSPIPSEMVEEAVPSLSEDLVLRMEDAVDRFESCMSLLQELLIQMAPAPAPQREHRSAPERSQQRPQEQRPERTRPFYVDESVRPVNTRFLMETLASTKPLEGERYEDDYE